MSYPDEHMVNDWNIHNDHADGIVAEVDDEREDDAMAIWVEVNGNACVRLLPGDTVRIVHGGTAIYTATVGGTVDAVSGDQEAFCRHCAAHIRRRAGQAWWEDDNGMVRCMKLPVDDIGKTAGEVSVPGHEPMPAGLAGEPTPSNPPQEKP